MKFGRDDLGSIEQDEQSGQWVYVPPQHEIIRKLKYSLAVAAAFALFYLLLHS